MLESLCSLASMKMIHSNREQKTMVDKQRKFLSFMRMVNLLRLCFTLSIAWLDFSHNLFRETRDRGRSYLKS